MQAVLRAIDDVAGVGRQRFLSWHSEMAEILSPGALLSQLQVIAQLDTAVRRAGIPVRHCLAADGVFVAALELLIVHWQDLLGAMRQHAAASALDAAWQEAVLTVDLQNAARVFNTMLGTCQTHISRQIDALERRATADASRRVQQRSSAATDVPRGFRGQPQPSRDSSDRRPCFDFFDPSKGCTRPNCRFSHDPAAWAAHSEQSRNRS